MPASPTPRPQQPPPAAEREPEMQRLTIDIPKELHTRLKIVSAKYRQSIRELTADWLEAMVEECERLIAEDEKKGEKW